MPLYRLTGKLLSGIKLDPFAKEKDIQSVVEANLKILFQLDLVRSEYPIGNMRVDTLAFDRESRAFVVIEFKKGQSFSVVDQGMSYLSLILNNKADVLLEYNERCNQTLKKDKVDWSQLRVLFVAESFTSYQVEALGFKDLPIELWKMNKFDRGLLTVDRVKPLLANASLFSIGKKSPALKKIVAEVKPNTEEMHLALGSPTTQNLYGRFKEMVLALYPNALIKPTKVYIGFKAKTNFTDAVLTKKALKVFINLPKGKLKDSKGMARDISQIGHWANGDYEVRIKQESDLPYVIELVAQSLNRNS